MELGKQPEILNQEIAQLEQKLAAKKQELLKTGAETPEKQAFKEVVREHAFASETPTTYAPSAAAQSATAARIVTPAEQEKINALIARAFTKGIVAAVAEARKANDPFLIDQLHDRLADEYYAKLLQARKIQQ